MSSGEKECAIPEVPAKNSWPELVGVKGETAKETIEKENPALEAIILKDGTPATLDYRFNRVRIWVDEKRLVVRTPTIG